MNRAVFVLLLTAGCGPEFAVIPQGGAPHVTAGTAGVYLSAFQDQWDADPHDLADWVTPIAVDLYNGTGAEIRVSLADFALRGQDGLRRPALNPFEGPIARLAPTLDPAAPLDDDGPQLQTGPLLASNGPILLASRGGGGHGGGGHFGGGGHYGSRGGARGSGGWRGGAVGGWRGGWGAPHRWGPGFFIHGGLRHYYGPGARYWGGPWAYPLWYSTWVYGWGTAGYGGPTADVLDYALPEGVLEPGASVNGFLYFNKATGPEVRSVALSWAPVDARTGAPAGQAQVMLDVVRR